MHDWLAFCEVCAGSITKKDLTKLIDGVFYMKMYEDHPDNFEAFSWDVYVKEIPSDGRISFEQAQMAVNKEIFKEQQARTSEPSIFAIKFTPNAQIVSRDMLQWAAPVYSRYKNCDKTVMGHIAQAVKSPRTTMWLVMGNVDVHY